MLITTAFGVLVGIVLYAIQNQSDRAQRIFLTVGLLLVSITMTLGADREGWLVFVEGSGVKQRDTFISCLSNHLIHSRYD